MKEEIAPELSSQQRKKKLEFRNIWKIVARELISIALMLASRKWLGAPVMSRFASGKPVTKNRKQRGAPRSFPKEE